MAEKSARAIDADAPHWAVWALALVLGLTALRVGFLALDLAPIHFDEAQYWTYGEALDWGYYSKPPMVAWLIRASTEIVGDSVFGVRLVSPLLHGWIAWLIFATARRLFDAQTGFWAAALYILLPGVAFSATLMSTDPPMMAAWAAGLYALVRAFEAEERGRAGALWWIAFGVAIGAGLLGKYTMVAFVGGLLGYALFSRERARQPLGAPPAPPAWRGPLLAGFAALAVFAPNLLWNAAHGFAAFSHVVDNSKLGGGVDLNPGKGFGFMIAQAGVFGPIALGALVLAGLTGRWRHEWRYRLLFWLAAPLPLIMSIQGFLARAHPNWAAPAYIAGAIIVAAWLLDRERVAWLRVSIAIGVVAMLGYLGAVAYYSERHAELPRLPDPFKRSRVEGPLCDRVAVHLGDRLLVGNRRVLARCMFAAKLPMARVRAFRHGAPGNHYQLVSPLTAETEGEMLLAVNFSAARASVHAGRFQRGRLVETGRYRTHDRRSYGYALFVVEGYDPPK